MEAVRAAWRAVDSGFSAVDAVVEGCSACEKLRCDGTGIESLSFYNNISSFFYDWLIEKRNKMCNRSYLI